MTFLIDLHGAVALLLFSSLLFAEEAGIPLFFAPGEAVLIAAGILIADGALSPWIFVPIACLAVLGGALTGYLWASAIGPQALEAIAERLHAAGALKRAEQRLSETGPLGIAASRSIPGLRIYTTLAAGAFRIDLPVFVRGVIPAAVGWVLLFTLLGALVGLPAAHLFGQVSRFLLQGLILVAAGGTALMALWYLQRSGLPANDLQQTPRLERVLLALAIDGGIVACLVAGVASLVRASIGAGDSDDFIDAILVVAATAVLYLVLSRRGLGGTGGEAILSVRYRSRPSRPTSDGSSVG